MCGDRGQNRKAREHAWAKADGWNVAGPNVDPYGYEGPFNPKKHKQ